MIRRDGPFGAKAYTGMVSMDRKGDSEDGLAREAGLEQGPRQSVCLLAGLCV